MPGGKGIRAPALKVGASASYGQVTPDGELQLVNAEGRHRQRPDPPPRRRPWPVEFRILGEDESTRGHPPAASSCAKPNRTIPGWGAEASEYEGEYELTNAAEDPTAKAGRSAP